MTQNGGIDVLIAWCGFGVLVAVLGWFLLRGHADTVRRADAEERRSSGKLPDVTEPLATPAASADRGDARPWWMSAVCYEVYVRSFADSDGSGEGDLPGVTQHLDYLAWLGVEAIWLCPFYPSPMADSGYDVADFCDVDPRFGSLADFDRLLAEAHARGIRVLIDWVPNHSSDRHPWFVDAVSGRDSDHRDWYYWEDRPNNWRSAIDHGSAWTLDEDSEQYYLHFFLPSQPDLNWTNPEVVSAMHDTLRFWLDRGVDGFRIDSAHCLGKDPTFSDDDRSLAGEPINKFNDQPQTHELLREIRALVDQRNAEAVLVGEVNLRSEASIVEYYGGGDELNLTFNFPPLDAPWDPIVWRSVVAEIEHRLGTAGAWPVWTLSNHDNSRVRTRYGGSLDRARAALVWLFALRGTVFIFQGEELGLGDVDLRRSQWRDPGGCDGSRGPIPWTHDSPHGWTGAEPWLPFAPDSGIHSVEAQREDPNSILHLTRRLIRLRHDSAVLRYGRWTELDVTRGVFAFRRELNDERFVCLVNFSDSVRDVPLDGRWEVHIDSTAFRGEAALESYDGRVQPAQALLLAPATTAGRNQTDVSASSSNSNSNSKGDDSKGDDSNSDAAQA